MIIFSTIGPVCSINMWHMVSANQMYTADFVTCSKFMFQTSFVYDELPVNPASAIKLIMQNAPWGGKSGMIKLFCV